MRIPVFSLALKLLNGVWLTLLLANISYAQPGSSGPQDVFKEVRLAGERFVRGAPVPSWVTLRNEIPESQDRGPSVLRLSETEFMVGDVHSVFVRRVWKINDASAVDQLGHVQIGFRSDYQSVRLHTLRVIRNSVVMDQTQNARLRYLQREAGLDQGVYDGEVTASILVDDLRVGDSLELAYTTDGSNPVFRGKFMDSASWDSSVAVEVRRVALHHPVVRPVQWRLVGDAKGPAPRPTETITSAMRSLRWEQSSLQPTIREPNIPFGYLPDRFLQFSEFSNWKEVATWTVQLFEPKAPRSESLLQLAQQFKGTTPEERVSQALEWVQSEIRYFSVSMGESSHQPAEPSETLKRRWGDCKDKAFLLIELFKAMGIEGRPVLVSTRDRVGLAKLLPTAFAFDHAIVKVRVNAKDYFLDPTRQGQSGRLDKMGQAHEGSDGLVGAAATDGISSIASENRSELSLNSLSENIKIDKLGGVGTIEVQQKWFGVGAENSRLILKRTPKEQLEKYLMASFEQRYPGAVRVGDSTIQDDVLNNALTITSQYSSPKMSVDGNSEWGVRYASQNLQGMLTSSASAIRTHPLAVSNGLRKSIYKVSVEFPKEVAVVSDPVSRSVKDPAFEFQVASSFRGNQASATLSLEVLQEQIGAENVPRYMEAMRKTSEIHRPFFWVGKGDLKSLGVLGFGAKTLQQTIEARLVERVEKVTKSLESGKIKGDDLALAYCDRAEAKIEQENGAEALIDAQAAVKFGPNLPDAYACRAGAWFILGDYSKSIADFNKTISLGNAEMHPFYRRGHSKFYSGQLAAALDDFAQAVSKGDGEGSLYAELWRVWTQMRLGIKPSADQLALASKDVKGSWPRPALAMLHGLVTVEDAIRSLDQTKGDEREMALAEAYFYVGQHFMAKGDRVKAADYFKKTRAQGIKIYVEHLAAGKELQVLGLVP